MEMQTEVVDAFLSQFQLKRQEIAALRESHIGDSHKVIGNFRIPVPVLVPVQAVA